MNITKLRRRCERLKRLDGRWYQRRCWFFTSDHEQQFEIGVTGFVTVLAILTISWYICSGSQRSITDIQLLLLGMITPIVMGLMYVSRLGLLIFDCLGGLTDSIHSYYERRLEVVSERLAKVETAALNRQSLLDEWAGVPDGAIMPVRLEEELADRGLSSVAQS